MQLKSAFRWMLFCVLSSILIIGISAPLFPLEQVLQLSHGLYGKNAMAVVREWHAAIGLFSGGSEAQRLKDVNEFFNRKLRFEDDAKLWGTQDYWATPLEALIKGAGDCEDFSIAKYVTLKYLGISASKMRITYVKAQIGGAASSISQAHMVLAYYPTPEADPLILDNLVSEIRPASRRPDLTPVFSFNSEGVWRGNIAESAPPGGSRISKWNDLLEKMKQEGFE